MRHLLSVFLFGCFSLLAACSQDKPKLVEPHVAVHAQDKQTAAISTQEAAKKVTEPQSRLPPSHCKSPEVAYLNSRVKKIHRSEKGVTTTPTQNILSLCIDGDKIIYRFGKINTVDIEKTATPEAPFYQHFARLGRIGMQRTFFNNGSYYYYVTESLGMGSGISIDVFDSSGQIADPFSGLDPEVDFWVSTDVQLPTASLLEKMPPHKDMQ
ncbi:hypothetical protein KO519_15710 [Paraglaciecola agarilytica]|uniref:hypothetical protein n=1 Tax=Paraglaciecola chathamensis TaxID=368405 RepID=UPI001C091004|nr:hypothetical protein [Paraglaciecola agarilytica]MBU3019128.1 hypothetical protein [Paraglaciecola agarilytica]